MKPLLSIIIPVYNASQFIERCLQSVERQPLSGLEVILVDDHGSDDSIAKARHIAEQSPRKDISWHFASTPFNSGPSAARNIGLQMAIGEYVAFLDADDWVEPEMYESLYKNALKFQADLSCCNAVQDYEDGRQSRVLVNPAIENGAFTAPAKRHFLSTFVAYFWTFIYRREWLVEHGIKFPGTKSAEDSSFLACCVLMADRVARTDRPLYHYVMHSGSLTGRRIWKGRDKRRSFNELIRFAKSKGVYSAYRVQLLYIYMKKAILVPIIEML